MALKHSYSLLAPFYDKLVSGPLDAVRRRSIDRTITSSGQEILIDGIGTGLDIPHLPHGNTYHGTDITPAMLRIAERRAQRSDLAITLSVQDSMALDFEDGRFDIIIMHLILAVVPEPVAALREAQRVCKTGGRIVILDKFIRPGQLALLRRTLSFFLKHIATRTDVVFEQVFEGTSSLEVVSDEPALAGGWFRLIELKKI